MVKETIHNIMFKEYDRKNQILYDETSQAFQEYGNKCVLDMLDNLYDLLKFVTDEFLDLFLIEYNTEIEQRDEDDLQDSNTQTETYVDPTTTFRLKSSPCVWFDISCHGFVRCDGAYYPCEINVNNESMTQSFYEDFCNKFLNKEVQR